MTARGRREFSLEQAREETPGCRHVVHLNSAGAALMPEPVLSAMVEHLRLEAEIGGYEAAERREVEVRRVYGCVAELIGCDPGEVASFENGSRAWSTLLQSLPLRPGDRLLVGTAEYASNWLALEAAVRKTGASVEVVPSDEAGRISLDALRGAVDERVRLVAAAHVPTYGCVINPVREIGEIASEAGALFLLDACQSVGQIPIDVRELRCDFLVGAGRKYLRGPRGTALLYVRHELLDRLEVPSLDVQGTRWLPGGRYELRDDARRFEAWEASCASRAGLVAALDYALAWGVETTWPRVAALGRRLRARLSEIPGVAVVAGGDETCGIVTFSVAGRGSEAVRAALRDARVNVALFERELTPFHGWSGRDRPAVRASVHYYNHEEEVDLFGTVLEEIVRGRRTWSASGRGAAPGVEPFAMIRVPSVEEGDPVFDEQEDTTVYKVVLNDEEQYSIWPADRENALGWRDEGTSGTKAECLAHIEQVWTDMRPLSLRKRMEEQEAQQTQTSG